MVALFVCDTGPLDEAKERVAAIKGFGKPVGDVVQPRPYITQQSLLDATQPDGWRYYWKSEYLPGIEKGLLDEYVKHGEKICSPHSAILLFPLHGKLSDLPEGHSAVGNRSAANINFLTDDETPDRLHDAYGDNYRRLTEIKGKYDPENFFRTNKNIPPA